MQPKSSRHSRAYKRNTFETPAGTPVRSGAGRLGATILRVPRLPFRVLIALAALGALVGGRAAYADHLAISSTSSQFETAQVNTTFPENISVKVVQLSDFSGVGNIPVTFTAPASGASGTFATTGTNTVTVNSISSGVMTGFANAPAFTANNIAGTYTINITIPAPHAALNIVTFTNSPGAPTGAALISQGNGSNQAAQINTAFAIQLSAAVFGGSNQLLSGITVDFAAPGSGASGTFAATGTNTTSVVTGATGLATASVFTANSIVGGPYTVTATVDGSQTISGLPISTSFSLNNTLNNPNGVPNVVSAAAGNGQQVPVLTTFPTNLQVVVLDGSLNYVQGATVVFTAPASGPSGTFQGGSTTFTTTSGATGLATATPFTANATAGSYSVAVSATLSGITANGVIGLANGLVNTTTTLTKNPAGDSVFGQTVVLTATVAPVAGTLVPAGPVTFKNGAASIGGCVSINAVAGVATCNVTGLAVGGPYTFSAEYLGDAVSHPSTSNSLPHTVTKASTSTGLTSSSPAVVVGNPVTFTATVTAVPPGAGTPSGQVTFSSSDGTLNANMVLVNGVAQVTTSALQVGTPAITAFYNGDANFLTSNHTLTQFVTKADTTTTVTSSQPAFVLAGNPVTFTAAVALVPPPGGTPTGLIAFSSSDGTLNNVVAPLLNGSASVTTSTFPTGTPLITATYNGDATSNGSSGTFTQSVFSLPQITLQPVNQTVLLGQQAFFSAAASGFPLPTVQWQVSTDGGANFTNIAGATSTTHSFITALADNNALFRAVFTNAAASATSQAATLSLLQAPSITSANATTFTFNQPGSFNVTATGLPAPTFSHSGALPTGVNFSAAGLLSGTPTQSGAFPIVITAANGVAPNATQNFTLTVGKANQAALFVTVTPPSGFPGDKLMLGTTGGSGTGLVTFSIGNSTGCALGTGADAGKLILLKGGGTCVVTATKAGDANFNPITSAPLTVGLTSATALASSANPSVLGQAVTFTATVTPISATGTVSFMDGNSLLGTGALAGGQATFTTSNLSAGTHQITAVYGGGGGVAGSTSTPLAQVVNISSLASTTTTLTSSANPSPAGQPTIFTAQVSPAAATGTVTFKDGNVILGTALLKNGVTTFAATLSAGTHQMTAVYGGDANFAASTSNVVVQVVKTATATTLTSSLNPSLPGQSVTFTAQVSPVGATGTVTFMDGNTVLGTVALAGGQATLTTNALSAGGHQITATYSGDANFIASTSNTLGQSVNTK